MEGVFAVLFLILGSVSWSQKPTWEMVSVDKHLEVKSDEWAPIKDDYLVYTLNCASETKLTLFGSFIKDSLKAIMITDSQGQNVDYEFKIHSKFLRISFENVKNTGPFLISIPKKKIND